MNKFFNSRFPILEAAMVGGSELPLALACWDAGVFPSLVIEYWKKLDHGEFNYDLVNDTLKEFIKSTGSADVLVAIGIADFFDKQLMSILKNFKVSHIEPLPKHDDYHERAKDIFDKNYNKAFSAIVKNMYPAKILWRVKKPKIDPTNGMSIDNKNLCFCIKGSDAAGMNGVMPTIELFNEQKKLTPNVNVIPYGGVGTPQQVKEYLDKGAEVVAVGTLFAASQESTLSIETKKAMVKNNKNNTVKLKDTGQNTLLLGKIEDVLQDKSNWNRGKSFEKGLHGDGKSGHIYVGHGIDHVKEIKTVKQIVEYLTSELDEKN
jgi:NAD(P)H-dependent flavin oxidoreductase YrpB (nitropropane dioxygenase family)